MPRLMRRSENFDVQRARCWKFGSGISWARPSARCRPCPASKVNSFAIVPMNSRSRRPAGTERGGLVIISRSCSLRFS